MNLEVLKLWKIAKTNKISKTRIIAKIITESIIITIIKKRIIVDNYRKAKREGKFDAIEKKWH